jgi:hypothetical protein
MAWTYVDPSDINSLNSLKSFIDALPLSTKVVLAGPIFFGMPNGFTQDLPDYQSRWAALTGPSGLSASQYQRVAAIYLVDEPDLHNGNPSATPSIPGVSEQRFSTARALVHSSPPIGSTHVPALATLYSYFVTTNGNPSPAKGIASVDWVGYDCYPVSDGQTWENCFGASMNQHLANLKAKRVSASQKILFVAEIAISRHYSGDPVSAQRRNLAIANLKRVRDFAMADPDIVGVVGFNREGLSGGYGWAGADTLPDVAASSRALGQCLLGLGACNY